MKFKLLLSTFLLFFFSIAFFAQNKSAEKLYAVTSYSDYTHLPNYIEVYDYQLTPENINEWMRENLQLAPSLNFKPVNTIYDELGYIHIRYFQYFNNIPVDGTMLLAHVKNGVITSINGDYYQNISENNLIISEDSALQSVLKKINAKKYKWENESETAHMKVALNNPSFSFYPKAQLVYVHKQDDTTFAASAIRLAYKFDIYAEQPLSRTYQYVDVETGKIIAQQNLIHHADVNGTANSNYSGTVNIKCDSVSPSQFLLKETSRGNGISTYNSQNSPVHSNIDFTSTSKTWALSSTDKVAADAHWGAEQTYDYFFQMHNRNGIDGNGYLLNNYVHYDVNYNNAFWDGMRMSYGDGDGFDFGPMVCLDICAHEITHGLVNFTAMLSGGSYGEPDAINEAWADIFATSVEKFAKGAQGDWIIGKDATLNGLGLRDMSDPHASASPGPQPHTYGGQYWSTIGQPHINDGPGIFWFYLLSQGGSGTNDKGNPYTVNAIGMSKAEKIAFRALTVYATVSTNYNNMRLCTIKAANDLYGACSNEAKEVANAWYAVGVGSLFSNLVSPSFTANITNICNVPFTVKFNNTSSNVTNAVWDFGDGGTSTQYNPSHTYTTAGTYTVKLIVSGGCGTDSVINSSYITISPPTAPSAAGVTSCSPGSFTLTATGSNTLYWYDTITSGIPIATGGTFTTPFLNATTTYYVENAIPGPSGTAGPANNSFANTVNLNIATNRYLIFNVIKPCKLISVLVYATGAGNRTIHLWDNMGKSIQSWTVNLNNGQNVVTLNASLTPGNGYRLGGALLNLIYNNAGANFPYNYTGYVSITGTNFTQNSYYFFYNWQIEADPCATRIPVTVTIGTGIPVTYSTIGYDTICNNSGSFVLTGGSPMGGVYSGNAVNNGVFDPASASLGNSMIVYTYTDSANCVGVDSQSVYIKNCVGIKEIELSKNIVIYPNPTSGQVSLIVKNALPENASIKISNSIGQIISERNLVLVAGENKFEIDLSAQAKGIYNVQISVEDISISKRLIKD